MYFKNKIERTSRALYPISILGLERVISRNQTEPKLQISYWTSGRFTISWSNHEQFRTSSLVRGRNGKKGKNGLHSNRICPRFQPNHSKSGRALNSFPTLFQVNISCPVSRIWAWVLGVVFNMIVWKEAPMEVLIFFSTAMKHFLNSIEKIL